MNQYNDARDYFMNNNMLYWDALANWEQLAPNDVVTKMSKKSRDYIGNDPRLMANWTLQKMRVRKTAVKAAEDIAKKPISERAKDMAQKSLLKKMNLKEAAKKWLKALL